MASYDFRSLSPTDFEDLTRDVLQAHWGITLEDFGKGPDQGIDLRYSAGRGHTIIVQAKHYADSGVAGLRSSLQREAVKIARIKPSRYVISTSVGLSPSFKDEIVSMFSPYIASPSDIFGRDDLNNLLGLYPKVEEQHFKLWLNSTNVLSRLINQSAYSRSADEAVRIKRAVQLYAGNPGQHVASRLLEDHHFLVITGGPGVGKSTLARVIAWLHVEKQWELISISDFDEVLSLPPTDEKRIFFFDDFLGQIQVERDVVRRTDSKITAFIDRVKSSQNMRFVLTTREYILRQAQFMSQRLASHEVELRKHLIDVSAYTRTIKAKIVYNHIYFSDLSNIQKLSILENRFYFRLIDHRNFSPRLVEYITKVGSSGGLSGDGLREWMISILDNPAELWSHPYHHHLSRAGRALVQCLFFLPDGVMISRLKEAFTRLYVSLAKEHSFSTDENDFKWAIQETEGSFIDIVSARAKFTNPSIRDFMSSALQDSRFPEIVLTSAAGSRQILAVVSFVEKWQGVKDTFVNARDSFASASRLLLQLPLKTLVRHPGGEIELTEGLSPIERTSLSLRIWQLSPSPETAETCVCLAEAMLTEALTEAAVEGALDLLVDANAMDDDFPRRGQLVSLCEKRAFSRIFEFFAYLGPDELSLYLDFNDNYSDLFPDWAREGVSELVDGMLSEVDEVIGELDSSSGLAGFGEQLERLSDWATVSTCHAVERTNERLAELEHDEQVAESQNDEVGFRPTRPVGDPSNPEIESMFTTLSSEMQS